MAITESDRKVDWAVTQQKQSIRQFVIKELKEGAPSPVPSSTFKAIGAKERQDLQRWIKQTPEILGEDIIIVGEEVSSWTKSATRLDLIAVDRQGKLVVVEIKREADPEHELQVLRYASYISTLSSEDVTSLYSSFLKAEGADDHSEAFAGETLAEFSDGRIVEIDEDEQPRMMLVAAGFKPEVMSTVMWLRKSGLDISCVRVEPFEIAGEVVLACSTLVPLPEAADYEIGLQVKRRAASAKKRPLDREMAKAFVASIPAGRWTSYGDVAEAAGNRKAPMAAGSLLKQADVGEIPLVYRVLNANGSVNQGWTAEDPSLPQTAEDVELQLQEEGVSFTEGKADQHDRWRPEDWKSFALEDEALSEGSVAEEK